MECTIPQLSEATGYQVIIHHESDIERLYIYHTQTAAFFPAMQDGMYQVVVLAVRNQFGIVGSNVEFKALVAVSSMPSTPIPPASTSPSRAASPTTAPASKAPPSM